MLIQNIDRVRHGYTVGLDFPRVVPVPTETVPVQPWVRFPWVAGTVFDETRGANGTRGYHANLIQVMLKTKLIYM
jgi:hypothetical protein